MLGLITKKRRYPFALFVFSLCFTHSSSANTASNYELRLKALHALSCPQNSQYFPFASIDIQSTNIAIGKQSDINKALPQGVSVMGAWELKAESSDFGGLSGLEAAQDGSLYAVSDQGNMFVITMLDGKPSGASTFSPLLNANGKLLDGKSDTDAEGLAYYNGLIFISFERNHRILAYDFESCGAAARGVHIITLPTVIEGESINPNNGAEALNIEQDDKLIAGYETSIDDYTIELKIDLDGDLDGTLDNSAYGFQTGPLTPNGFKLVGASKSAYLFRAYDPVRGNRNIIRLHDGREFKLNSPLLVDNFEGITQIDKPQGGYTLYIISDDNFSNRQKTLLYAFDVESL